MKIANDNLWLCADCTLAAVNDDLSSLDYYYGPEEASERQLAILAGLQALPRLTKGNAEIGFDDRPCDCCRTRLAGERHHFLQLD